MKNKKISFSRHPRCEAIERKGHCGSLRAIIYVDGVETSIVVSKYIDIVDDSTTVQVGWASHGDKSIEMCERFARAMPFALKLAKSYELNELKKTKAQAQPHYIVVDSVDVEGGGGDEYIVIDENNPEAMRACVPNKGVFENEGWAEEKRDELNDALAGRK